jgi:hypothetical protein
MTKITLAVSALMTAVTFGSLLISTVSAQNNPGPTTAPSTRPAAQAADQLLNQMLRPADQAARPLVPVPDTDVRDLTTGRSAIAPGAPSMNLLREGSFVVDRTGRLARAKDSSGFEFVFDADGRTLRDPPMLILANSKLQVMEDSVKNANRDLRFRITGVVTEYRGRNGVLIEKVIVIPDVVQQN